MLQVCFLDLSVVLRFFSPRTSRLACIVDILAMCEVWRHTKKHQRLYLCLSAPFPANTFYHQMSDCSHGSMIQSGFVWIDSVLWFISQWWQFSKPKWTSCFYEEKPSVRLFRDGYPSIYALKLITMSVYCGRIGIWEQSAEIFSCKGCILYIFFKLQCS